VLLASPSHSTELHALTSRSVRRDPSLLHSPALAGMRGAFQHVASARRAARSRVPTLSDRIRLPGGTGGGGQDESEREADLRRALEAAMGGLGVLGRIFEERETRWSEEFKHLRLDRERVELLLKQSIGVGLSSTGTNISVASSQ
jgi:hypothetical protein